MDANAPRLERHDELTSLVLLERGENGGHAVESGVARLAEHAHQALLRNTDLLAESFEAHRGIDIIAQYGFCDIRLASQERLSCFSKKCTPELGVSLCTFPNGVLEVSRKRHVSFLSVFAS